MKGLLKWSGIALLAGLALLTAYGVLVEPRLILDERRYSIALPRVDQDWEGAEVAVFADLQVGMWLANINMVRRVVARVVEADPDAVLLAGDFVYSDAPDVAKQVDNVVELLAPLTSSGIPIYAVMGNHDYAVGAADELTVVLEQRGVVVLLNESAAVPSSEPGGAEDQLYIVGLGPHRPGLSRPDRAFAGVPDGAPRVVFIQTVSGGASVGSCQAPRIAPMIASFWATT